jgi:hypothetical protein
MIKVGDYINIDGGNHKVLSITKDKVLVEGGSENGKNGYVGYDFAIKNKVDGGYAKGGKYEASFEVHVEQLNDMKPFLKKQKVEFRCVEYVDTDVYIVQFVSEDKGKLWDIYKEATGYGEEDKKEFYNEQIDSFKKWGKDVYGAHTHDDESEYYSEKAKNGANIGGSTVKDNRMNERTRAVILKIQKTGIHPDDVSPNFVSEVADENGINLSSKEVVFISDNYSKKFGNGGGVGKKPKMVRTIFEDEEYEYKNGGGVGVGKEFTNEDLEEIVGDFSKEQYDNFCYNYDIDFENGQEMSNFIYGLNKNELNHIKKEIDANKFRRGGRTVKPVNQYTGERYAKGGATSGFEYSIGGL